MKHADNILNASDWYHKITLTNGIVTPGKAWDDLWENIRGVRSGLDYRGKSVLDLGSMDGMWAFEAEQLGAEYVVTVEQDTTCMNKLLYCRGVLKSQVIPLFNVKVQTLEHDIRSVRTPFDIIQHLGMFYHLEDPLSSLAKCRGLIKPGGFLLLETAAEKSQQTSCMIFNGVKPHDYQPGTGYWWRMYTGSHPQWMPTIPCLKELLLISGFLPLNGTISIIDQPESHGINADQPETTYKRCRVALLAQAVKKTSLTYEAIRNVLTVQ